MFTNERWIVMRYADICEQVAVSWNFICLKSIAYLESEGYRWSIQNGMIYRDGVQIPSVGSEFSYFRRRHMS